MHGLVVAVLCCALQAAVAALPKEAWTYEYQAKYSAVMAGREGNQNAFKPGGLCGVRMACADRSAVHFGPCNCPLSSPLWLLPPVPKMTPGLITGPVLLLHLLVGCRC